MNNIFFDNNNSLLSIARNLYNRGDFKGSQSKFESCLKLSPDEPVLLFEYACCLFHLKDFDNSIVQLQKLISIDPDHARAQALLGTIYSDLGEKKKSSKHHFLAIKSNPLLTQSAYGYAKSCDVELNSKEFIYLESLLNQPKLDQNGRIRILFSLAEIHQQNHDYQGQIECLRKANQLAEKCFPFSADAQHHNSSRIIAGFSKITEFDCLLADKQKTPIFILGLPRCGSTLLEQMLSEHSQLKGIGETDILSKTVGYMQHNFDPNQAFPEEISQLQRQHWQQATEFFDHQLDPNVSENIVEKQLFNFTLLGFAKLLKPGSLFIDLRRNPSSQFISCYSILFGENRGFTHNVERFVDAYNNQRRLMQFWKQKFPENIITIFYENLVADPEHTIKKIFKKLNLQFENSCLEFYNSKQAVSSASQFQVKQPVYTKAVDRWSNYKQFMQTEDSVLKPLVEEYNQQMGEEND